MNLDSNGSKCEALRSCVKKQRKPARQEQSEQRGRWSRGGWSRGMHPITWAQKPLAGAPASILWPEGTGGS